jgi:glucosamine-6-phosphate deaminase
VRVVPVVEASRRQLAEDPHFGRSARIPERGITMTMPALLSARHLFTIVPYASKRPIITRLLALWMRVTITI